MFDYIPFPSFTHTHTHTTGMTHFLDAWVCSVRPKHLAYIDETNKFFLVDVSTQVSFYKVRWADSYITTSNAKCKYEYEAEWATNRVWSFWRVRYTAYINLYYRLPSIVALLKSAEEIEFRFVMEVKIGSSKT